MDRHLENYGESTKESCFCKLSRLFIKYHGLFFSVYVTSMCLFFLNERVIILTTFVVLSNTVVAYFNYCYEFNFKICVINPEILIKQFRKNVFLFEHINFCVTLLTGKSFSLLRTIGVKSYGNYIMFRNLVLFCYVSIKHYFLLDKTRIALT